MFSFVQALKILVALQIVYDSQLSSLVVRSRSLAMKIGVRSDVKEGSRVHACTPTVVMSRVMVNGPDLTPDEEDCQS